MKLSIYGYIASATGFRLPNDKDNKLGGQNSNFMINKISWDVKSGSGDDNMYISEYQDPDGLFYSGDGSTTWYSTTTTSVPNLPILVINSLSSDPDDSNSNIDDDLNEEIYDPTVVQNNIDSLTEYNNKIITSSNDITTILETSDDEEIYWYQSVANYFNHLFDFLTVRTIDHTVVIK